MKRSLKKKARPVTARRLPLRTIVLGARQIPSHLACGRCERQADAQETEFGRVLEFRRLVRVPSDWRVWLCLEQHGCGPEHWVVLCPNCASELIGNHGDFLPGKGAVIDERAGQ